MPYDLFLSHNRRQKPWVRELARFLRNLGFTVFFDEDSIKPGQDVVRALEAAVESTKTLVFIISGAAIRSRWVSFETAMQLYADPTGDEKRIVPIIAEPVSRSQISLAIRRLDAVDLTNPDTREPEFVHFLRSLGVPEDRCTPIGTWPEPMGIEELRVADINTVVREGWTGVELLERLIGMDYVVFDGLTTAHEGTAEQWAPVFMNHPDTWRFLTTDAQEIVGYWHFVPLFADDFERASAGTLLDSEIVASKVRLFELPGWYDVYFVSIGLLSRYRRPKAFARLFESLLEVLSDLAANRVFVDKICTNAYTQYGESLCQSLGLKAVCGHRDRGTVYSGQVENVLASLPFAAASTLADQYARARALRR